MAYLEPPGHCRTLGARWWGAGIVLLNALVIGVAGFALWQARGDAEAQAGQSTRQLALTLEKELSGVLHASEIILVNVRDEVAHTRRHGRYDPGALSAMVERQRAHLPYIDGVYVADAEGNVVYGMAPEPDRPAAKIQDRPYFKHLTDQTADEAVLSKPIRSRVTGAWVLVVARRINLDSGAFGGAVLVTISIERLTRTFAQIGLPYGASITLRGQGLGLIARYPSPAGDIGTFLGQSEVSREFAERLASGATEGTYQALTPFDQTERILSFRKLEAHPLYLVVGRAKTEYLAPWHGALTYAVFAVGAFVALSALLSILVLNSWRRLTTLNRTLEHMAHTDYLTGLMNRRALLECAEIEIERSRRYGKPPSVLMLDIDHFKDINDRFGHVVGDAALRQFAGVLRSTFRTVDLLGRWGGEEFVVFMPETPLAGALDVAERIRHAIENTKVAAGVDTPLRLTVSIGVASLLPTDDVDTVIARADSALYRAKNAGRNSVCCAETAPMISLET